MKTEAQQQKILAGPVGSPIVEELRGVAVGIAEDGRVVVARGCLAGMSRHERVRVAHALADLVAEVVLHVRGDGATLDDGSPISQSAVIGALSGGFVRALIHDAAGTPVNASGRQRHPTTRQKRVVTERDRRCVDCGGHDLLEFDHVPEFAISGHTYVDELQLRCAACHRARHVRSGLRGSGPAPTRERGTP